jgi:hypothetical protein
MTPRQRPDKVHYRRLFSGSCEAAAKAKENLSNRMKFEPEINCYMPGIPRRTTCRCRSRSCRGPNTYTGGGRLRPAIAIGLFVRDRPDIVSVGEAGCPYVDFRRGKCRSVENLVHIQRALRVTRDGIGRRHGL